MSRTQFSFTFTNAQPGAAVHFSAPVYADAIASKPDGPTLVLNSANAVSVWADAGFLIAMTVDGNGNDLAATATATDPTVTNDTGTAGTSPFGSGGSSLVHSALYIDNGASGVQILGNGGNHDIGLVESTALKPTGVASGLVGPSLSWDPSTWTVTFNDDGIYAVTLFGAGFDGNDSGTLSGAGLGAVNSDAAPSAFTGLAATGFGPGDFQGVLQQTRWFQAGTTVRFTAAGSTVDPTQHFGLVLAGWVERLS